MDLDSRREQLDAHASTVEARFETLLVRLEYTANSVKAADERAEHRFRAIEQSIEQLKHFHSRTQGAIALLGFLMGAIALLISWQTRG